MLGAIVTSLTGLVVSWDELFAQSIEASNYVEFFVTLLGIFLFGITMSVVSQAGFFFYLTLHQVGVNIFKSLTLWNWVQLLLIIVVIFDLITFRFIPNANGNVLPYILLVVFILIVAAITAYYKGKMTKKHAVISALFFMIVMTIVEFLPASKLRDGNFDSMLLTIFPLMAVNAYQLLKLPKYNAKSEEDRKRLEERKKLRAQQVK